MYHNSCNCIIWLERALGPMSQIASCAMCWRAPFVWQLALCGWNAWHCIKKKIKKRSLKQEQHAQSRQLCTEHFSTWRPEQWSLVLLLTILLSCFYAASFCLLIYSNTLPLACLFLKRWLLMTAKITRGWYFFFFMSTPPVLLIKSWIWLVLLRTPGLSHPFKTVFLSCCRWIVDNGCYANSEHWLQELLGNLQWVIFMFLPGLQRGRVQFCHR